MISQEKLKANGFQGFKSINALEENNIYLPNEMGVYIVLTPDNFKINFTYHII